MSPFCSNCVTRAFTVIRVSTPFCGACGLASRDARMHIDFTNITVLCLLHPDGEWPPSSSQQQYDDTDQHLRPIKKSLTKIVQIPHVGFVAMCN